MVNEQIEEYLSEGPSLKDNQSGTDVFYDPSKLNFNPPEYDSEIDPGSGRNSEVNAHNRMPSFAKGGLVRDV